MDKGIVDAQAAVLTQQLVRIGVDLGRGMALHPNIRRQAVAVLALGAAALGLSVVADGAVARVDVQRCPKCTRMFSRMSTRVWLAKTGREPSVQANSYTWMWGDSWRLASVFLS